MFSRRAPAAKSVSRVRGADAPRLSCDKVHKPLERMANRLSFPA
jgi:hypothetical protein